MDHMPLNEINPMANAEGGRHLVAGFDPLPRTDYELCWRGSITRMPGYRATDLLAYAERQVARALREAGAKRSAA